MTININVLVYAIHAPTSGMFLVNIQFVADDPCSVFHFAKKCTCTVIYKSEFSHQNHVLYG